MWTLKEVTFPLQQLIAMAYYLIKSFTVTPRDIDLHFIIFFNYSPHVLSFQERQIAEVLEKIYTCEKGISS